MTIDRLCDVEAWSRPLKFYFKLDGTEKMCCGGHPEKKNQITAGKLVWLDFPEEYVRNACW